MAAAVTGKGGDALDVGLDVPTSETLVIEETFAGLGSWNEMWVR